MEPGNLASGDMIKFLESALAELDAAAGGRDEEAHQKLAQLRRETAVLDHLSSPQNNENGSPPELSDVEIARQIDRLESQLSSVERRLAEADACTKQLLGAGTQIWMGKNEDANANGQNE